MELPVTEPEELFDVNDYKFLIGTEHVDPEDATLYRTTEVIVEESDPEIGPQIVAYRRRVKPNGTLYPLNDDDDWPYIIDIIVEYTANHYKYKIDTLTSKTSTNVTEKKIINDYTEALKNNIFKSYIAKAKIPYIFPANRLPRNKIDIDNMAD